MRKADTNKINFHFTSGRFHFDNRTQLKAYLLKQLKKEGKAVETINYIFCDGRYLLSMNQEYLKHNTYTDIITFELSPKGQPLLSDIYISIERVAENARLYNTTFKMELHRVIFHGTLHLAGYKDKNKEQAQVMRMKEEEYLSRYLVPRGTGRYKH